MTGEKEERERERKGRDEDGERRVEINLPFVHLFLIYSSVFASV